MLISLIIWQSLFNWQPNFPVFTDFARWRAILKWLKPSDNRLSRWRPIAAIAREVGCSKCVISRILGLYNVTNSFKSPKNAGHPWKTNAWEDRIMWRISMGNRFNTAAGIARQLRAEQGKDLSQHTVSRRLDNSKRTFVEFTSMMKACLIYLGPMGNIMFVIKLGKDWTPSV